MNFRNIVLKIRVGCVYLSPQLPCFFFHTSTNNCAGHSKWANIRHIKALKDRQKSELFTRLARQIRLAIQEGKSADPAKNATLKNVVEDALRKNMPMATIQNSIKKFSQSKELLRKHLYIRFQHKVSIVCVLYTDNFPHLKMEVASLLKKAGAAYEEIQHLFHNVGIIEATACDEVRYQMQLEQDLENICTEDAINCGAEAIQVIEYKMGLVKFICNPFEIRKVTTSLKTKGYTIENIEYAFSPKKTVKVSEIEFESYKVFLSKLRGIPGVEAIYDNLKED